MNLIPALAAIRLWGISAPDTGTAAEALIQTGQLNWPIPVLVCGGLFFLVLGIILLRRKDEPDDE